MGFLPACMSVQYMHADPAEIRREQILQGLELQKVVGHYARVENQTHQGAISVAPDKNLLIFKYGNISLMKWL